MAVENEVDNRHRQERALQVMINEKKSELDRYRVDKLLLPVSKKISFFLFLLSDTRRSSILSGEWKGSTRQRWSD